MERHAGRDPRGLFREDGALSDVGNDATIGAAGASNDTTYYSDKTHLTTAGYAIVATYMKNAINAL